MEYSSTQHRIFHLKTYPEIHCASLINNVHGKQRESPEKWVREEAIDRPFSQVIGSLKMDTGVSTIKESHQNEKQCPNEQIANLQKQCNKIQQRLDTMYIDKLDGRIDQDFHDRKRFEWQNELDDIFRKIERHSKANRAYFDDGIKLLE